VDMLIISPDKNTRQNMKTPRSYQKDRNAIKALQQENTPIEFFETRVINYGNIFG